ncbi:MAG: hypothetical protein MET45_28245 [Nostoc sp. LLA-1]|nr:hypothetical protein [Cyanocohniella sp. LLY]
MKNYKVKYWDCEGEGTTIINSPDSLTADDAATLINEQLKANEIDTTDVQIEIFREIKNPLDNLVANIQRFV